MRIEANNDVPWRVDMPDRDDAGEVTLVPVVFRLRIYTREELRARARQRGATATDALATAMRQLIGAKTAEAVDAAAAAVDAAAKAIDDADKVESDDLAARVVGWREGDVTDDAGQPVPFTAQLRDALLKDSARYNALQRGLLEASEGARRKNSLPGPAGSQADAQAGEANNSGVTAASN